MGKTATISFEDRVKIAKAYAADKSSAKDIAEKFNCSTSMVYKLHRLYYKHGEEALRPAIRKHNLHLPNHEKLRIVKDVIEHQLHPDDAEIKHKVSAHTIKKWLKNYKEYGEAGLFFGPGRVDKKYTHDFKLSVVLDYKSRKQSYTNVAHKYDIAHHTVKKWVELYEAQGDGGLHSQQDLLIRQVGTHFEPKNKDIQEQLKESVAYNQLLKENSALKAENAFLKKAQALIQTTSFQRSRKQRSSKN